ncbi:DNA primase [Streptomyces sp. PmtG]
MMTRTAVALGVGAGYVLGRTKKAKLAFALGTMVAGRRLKLSPASLGRAVTAQLENNPQFKEIGDQLKEDLRGVGKAATGSLVERRLDSLADRLHDRTLDVRDRLAVGGSEAEEEPDRDSRDSRDSEPHRDEEPDRDTARKGSGSQKGRRSAAKRTTGGRAAGGGRAVTKKAAAKRTTAKRPAATRSTAKRKSGRSQGGDDD